MSVTLDFPDYLLNTPYEMNLFTDKVSKTGGYETALNVKGKCILTEKSQTVLDSESKKVISNAYIIIKGDIAPAMAQISNGEVVIHNRKYSIIAADRPRNPDGTVFSTEVYLR